MKRNWKVVSSFLIALMLMTGCGEKEATNTNQTNNQNSNQGSNQDVSNQTSNQSTNQETAKTGIKIGTLGNFEDGKTVVSANGTHYLIDNTLQVLTSYTGIGTYIDGYIFKQDESSSKKHQIVDSTGNVVLSYEDGKEYEKVELVDNGCILTKREVEDWQSSQTFYGIYSLKDQKYVLKEETDKYENMKAYGDNMVSLDSTNKTFFNTKTQKTIQFKERVEGKFKDGYSIHTSIQYGSKNKIYLHIFKEDGTYKKVEIPYEDDDYSNISAHANGVVFIQDCHFNEKQETVCQSIIVDLETAKIVDLKNTYNNVTNDVSFNKEGYAMLVFANTGFNYYYTVIDKNGNRLFEPVKSNPDNSYLSSYDKNSPNVVHRTIYDGGYFITEQNGTYTVRDKNNQAILVSGANEKFDSITDRYIRVTVSNGTVTNGSYYKLLDGTIKDQIYQ